MNESKTALQFCFGQEGEKKARWFAGEEAAIIRQRCGQNAKYIFYRRTRWFINQIW